MTLMSDERDREETLKVLVELVVADDAASCYDGGRALRLLRSQSSPEELERLGVDAETIKLVWPEGQDG